MYSNISTAFNLVCMCDKGVTAHNCYYDLSHGPGRSIVSRPAWTSPSKQPSVLYNSSSNFIMATDILNSKKILISGGTGFVGSATVRALAAKHPGSAITVIDRSPPQTQHPLPKGTRCIQVDITSANEVARVLQTLKPNIVVHTAGIVPSLADRFRRELEREVWKTNVEGTRNMLNASLENDVEAFIYTSSCCVVTDNTSTPYRNIDEEWPASQTSLIYGESKVVVPSKKSQEMELALTKKPT